MTPPITVEEFARQLRGERGYGSDSERAATIAKSELCAAAAFDYCRIVGYSSGGKSGCKRVCAGYIAQTLREDGIDVPEKAFGMPVFLVLVLYGPQIVAWIKLIWQAASMVEQWLTKPGSAA